MQQPPAQTKTHPAATLFAVVGSLMVLVCFFYLLPGYGPGRNQSLLEVLYDSWNTETRYEHGVMFPFIIIGLLLYKWKEIKKSLGSGEHMGLCLLILGCALFVISYRVIQWRVGVGSLPIIISGLVWFLWGKKAALASAFIVFYIWLSIPLPDVQQATVPLQNISVMISQKLCTLCGVDTYAQGSKIFSTDQNWKPLEVDELCSGIRSLMALIMISSAWAYLAKMSLWKKAILLLSALPLAIIGNGLRVSSIFIMAEYGNEEFARTTWHDNSGLLLFYPISLLLMMGLHTVLEGGLPWTKRKLKRTVITNESISQPASQV
jgi:exosortase